MDVATKAKLKFIAATAESNFDRTLIWLAGSPYTLALFVAWTLGAVAFGLWAGRP